VTPVLRFTRGVFVAGVCLTAGTGLGLYLFPERNHQFWAWTIEAAPSAAFFGAGYLGAGVALLLAARTREWPRARVVAVAALTLTSLALLATLLNLDTFAFGEGGLREAVAWIWLAVYVALPPAVLVAFVLQQRPVGVEEHDPDARALAGTRVAFGVAGVALGALGLGLVADWGWLAARWPWPLPALPAAVVGTWVCTYAASFLWFAFRERRWRRVRIAAGPAAFAVALDLAAAARFSGDFDGGASTALYIAALAALLVVIACAAVVEERRLRTISG
jgi:hypothetical protein